MPGSRVVFDGLWRCLCPSVDPIAASRLLNSPVLPANVPRASTTIPSRRPPALSHPGPQCRSRGWACQRRHYGDAPVLAGQVATSYHGEAPSHDSDSAASKAVSALLQATPADLQNKVLPSLKTGPNDATTTEIEAMLEALERLRHRPNGFQSAAVIAKHLVQERGLEPTPRLYECLMACACDARASGDMVAQLLAEMRQLKFPIGSRLCHDALEALAVHPNYLLRNEILWAMKQSWTDVDPNGQCHVALGLLRDGQYELAFDKMEELLDERNPVTAASAGTAPPPPWLFDIFVLVLAQQGFLDEAVRLAHEKASATGGHELPDALWHLLLDSCARASHYEGTKYVWGRLGADTDQDLQTHQRGPAAIADGTLTNVMNTAARNADPELAAEATAALSSPPRAAKLAPHHYEALIDAYAGRGDVASALRVACIMQGALAAVSPASLRSVYAYLVTRQPKGQALDAALEALVALRRDGSDVPAAALLTVIEAAVRTRGFAKAYEIWTASSRYCGAAVDHVAAFKCLLPACDDARALRQLVVEKPDAAIEADASAVERAVGEFAAAGELDRAYECVGLLSNAAGDPSATAADVTRPEATGMQSRGQGYGAGKTQAARWLSRATALTLVRRSLDAQDERVWGLLEEAKARGLDVQSGLSRLLSALDGPPPAGRERPRREITSGRRVGVPGSGQASGDEDATPFS